MDSILLPRSRRRIAALAVEVSAAVTEFRVFPVGEFRSRDGRPVDAPHWRMDAEIAAKLVAQVASAGVDTAIDYNHQTLLAEKNGQPAPAAGWFATLEWRENDGLYATGVRWTDRAAEFIEADEYRYISPVFTYDRTGAPLALLHVAITNTPALGNQDAITAAAAASLSLMQEPPMNEELIEQLRWLLNLPVGATAEDISTQLQKLIDQLRGSGGAVAAASFDLSAHLVAQGQKIAALQAAAPDLSKFVPLDVHVAQQAELAALQAQLDGAERERLIGAALDDGRITPAVEAYWRDQPVASLQAYLAKATPMAALGRTQSGGKAPAGANEVAAEPRAIADAAIKYQGEQAALGYTISTAQAVAHVTREGA